MLARRLETAVATDVTERHGVERPHLRRSHGWNVHNEYGSEGYKGGVKRRPRDEWVIQRDTHPALISDAIAETLLANLGAAGTPRGAIADPSSC